MRVLVNTTNLRHGGGLQVGVSLLRHAFADRSEVQWRAAISSPVAEELQRFGALDARRTHRVESSPARSRDARRRLEAIEREVAPDVVFTVFGPAYARFAAPHLMGVADGWVTHSTRLAYRSLGGPIHQLKMLACCLHKTRWLREADAWWVEAECSRNGLRSRVGIPPSKVSVVPNTRSQQYQVCAEPRRAPAASDPLRLLTFATGSLHKNHRILPAVAAAMRRVDPSGRYEFLVTLPESHPVWREVRALAWRLGVQDMVRNLGPVAVADGPEVYDEVDACFMPTLLETSSASYPEAMAMGIPVVTTDLPFAREACADSALYYSPLDANSAAGQIAKLRDPTTWRRLVEGGRQRATAMPSSRDRFETLKKAVLALSADNRPGASRLASAA